MPERAASARRAEEPLSPEWKAVLEQMPAGVLVARAPDGEVVFGNAAAESICGTRLPCSRAGAEADLWRAYHPDGRIYEAEEWPIARSLRTGEVVEEELAVERGDGSRAVVCMRVSPLRGASGGITGAVATLTDVTRQRRMEAARELLASAGASLASTLDYAATLGNVARLAVPGLADWCAVYVQKAGEISRVAVEHGPRAPARAVVAEEPYPVETAAMLGVVEAVRREKPELIPEITAAMLASAAGDAQELRALRELHLRSAIVIPLVGRGRLLGAITLATAGPGRSYDAEDLAVAEELAGLAALAIDNARLYEESQTANQAKSDFLSVISHELRTPLTAVIGYAELLALGIPEPLTERQSEQIERIEVSARHLLQLIEEILTAASLDAGTITIYRETVELTEVLQRAVAMVHPLALEKNLDLALEPPAGPIEVETDPDRILQILLNLLSNAVKFTDEGSIAVSVRRGEEFAEVSIRDTGIGISAAQKERIFDAFWQAEQPITRRVGGTGLGLTISRRLLDLLGGEMEVTSEPGRGSVFTARVPLS